MSKTKIAQLKSYVREYWSAYNVSPTAVSQQLQIKKTEASFFLLQSIHLLAIAKQTKKERIGVHEWINLMLRQLNSSAKFGHMKFDYQTAFLFHHSNIFFLIVKILAGHFHFV